MATLADSQPPGSMLSEQLAPDTRVGNYRLLRLLGKGGMGAVYEAMHLYIERRAAIKVLHAQLSRNSEFRTRFLNEARAVNLIKHPGLVEVYEFGLLTDGTAYIVMEFLHGESLEQHIKQHPQGLGHAALPLAHDIAQAMVAAHQKGIVHRGPRLPSRSRYGDSAPVETLRKMASRRLLGSSPRAVRGATEWAGSVPAAATGSLPLALRPHCAASRCAPCKDSGADPRAVRDARFGLTRTGTRPA